MRSRFIQSLLLLLSLWLLAGPLALLQLGAWTWMLASYSQESSIEQAFRETFGGDRPCELCKVIDAVEDAGQKQDPSLPAPKPADLKLMLGLGRSIIVPEPGHRSIAVDFADERGRGIVCSVPTPPPRLEA